MNLELFIARRLSRERGKRLSRPIIIIAIISIALAIATMVVSISVLQGFQDGIKEKISGFSSHIQILSFASDNVNNNFPITLSKENQREIASLKNIKTINPFILQGGIIKTSSDVKGIVLKAVDNQYDSSFFHNYIVEGRFINTLKKHNEIIISSFIANKLSLNLGDKLRIYFIRENSYKVRVFDIVGIYQTGLASYDEKFAICDIDILQKLNNWSSDEFSGYEIKLKDFSLLEKTANGIYSILDEDKTIQRIDQIEPSLFSWLSLLDSNVMVILTILTLVCIVTMVSTLLIIIFEQTSNIGILKSIGIKNRNIIKIFMFNAAYIVLKGLLYGNVLALALCYLQKNFHIIRLNESSYFLTSVPIEISFIQILIVNLATIIICLLALLIPAKSISRIEPIVSIRFD
ncbi:MAG: ABC transporter permease [Bacteroidales bacterium]|jgi:lipoprotein-releasing system permease protein|nr:ABC transporter permease [Bacteroidales bacterium]